MNKYLLTFAFTGSLSGLISQELSFVHLNQALVDFNPSFAGSNGLVRNQFSFRRQWPDISGTLIRYTNTFDMYVKPIKAGIALTGDYDNYARGVTDGGLGFVYAQHIGLKDGRSKFVPSLQLSYRQVVFDYRELPLGGYPSFIWSSTQSLPDQEKKSYIDFSSGLLYALDDRLFLGIAEKHMGSNVFITDHSEFKKWAKYSFYGSYNFMLSDRSAIQVVCSAARQQKSTSSRIGTNIILWRHFMAGAGWLSGDALALNAGYRGDTFSFLLGYDLTYSKLPGNSAGSWELHASYNLRKKEIRYTATSFEKL